MSEEMKHPAASPQEQPFNPFLGLDIGERWGRELGSIDSRLTRVENDIQKLDAKFDALDAKTDKMVVAINRLDERLIAVDNRLDERTKNLDSKFNLSIGLTGAVLAAVIAGFILQFFLK